MRLTRGIAAVLAVMTLLLSLASVALAAQPDTPTARAEAGSFNKAQTGLDHQSEAAWEHDGPASPHAEWD